MAPLAGKPVKMEQNLETLTYKFLGDIAGTSGVVNLIFGNRNNTAPSLYTRVSFIGSRVRASQFSENLTNAYTGFFFILVNAADNKQRDPKMNCIRIEVDRYEYFIMVSAGFSAP